MSKKMDGDKFERNYSYNIRHMFGQEGKRNDYRPWNCNKVLNQQAPGQGEYHGCPFKTFGDENMR
jgi:DNA primase large subunit